MIPKYWAITNTKNQPRSGPVLSWKLLGLLAVHIFKNCSLVLEVIFGLTTYGQQKVDSCWVSGKTHRERKIYDKVWLWILLLLLIMNPEHVKKPDWQLQIHWTHTLHSLFDAKICNLFLAPGVCPCGTMQWHAEILELGVNELAQVLKQ